LKPIDKYVVEYGKYSFSKEKNYFKFREGKSNITQRQDNNNALVETSTNLQDINIYNVGDYILIQWLGKKSVCRYVAEIVSMEDDTYEVACMRKQDSKGLIYSFPEKDDKCWIDKDQIIQKLKKPSIVTDGSCTRIRNRFVFDTCITAE
jgi:hypothetical protein